MLKQHYKNVSFQFEIKWKKNRRVSNIVNTQRKRKRDGERKIQSSFLQ